MANQSLRTRRLPLPEFRPLYCGVIEKAFAIKAGPATIWRALMGDLDAGDSSAYEIEEATPNEQVALWVGLQGGIRARLTYTLIPRDGLTEVVATMEPRGLRYTMARIITFGRIDTNYELVLVQGLANLKNAAESAQPMP